MTSIPLRENAINAAVNALYKNLETGSIKASDPIKKAADFNGDGSISKDELKRALKEDRLALSLKEFNSGGINGVVRLFNSADVAVDVVNNIDGTDGRSDGKVSLGQGLAISNGKLAEGLMQGEILIGSQLMDKEDVKAKGIKIVELHQNQDGAKLVTGR